RDRNHAPCIFLRRTFDSHGARRLLFCGRGNPADISNSRSMELLATRRAAGGQGTSVLPALLGGYVPCFGGILEFPRGGSLWVPDQSANCFILRNWHSPYGQSRARRD